MIKALCVLAFATSAAASALNQPALKPALALRGGAYPPPKAGYHALAAKGAAATKMEVAPNLLSGALAGCYVAFGLIEERRTSIDGWTAAVLTGSVVS